MKGASAPLSLNAWLRWDVVRRTLDELDGVRSVLEVGPGLGAVAERLALRYDYVGVERDSTSLAVARKRLERVGRGRVLHGDLDALGVESGFDLVCAFEVLEHVTDDAAAARDWASKLRTGGTLLISVPAWRRLWGSSDSAVGHLRRYDRDDLVAVLEQAGLDQVRVLTYGFPLGYALHSAWDLAASRRRERPLEERTAQSGRWFQPRQALSPVTRAASFPFRVVQRPFATTDLGTGFVATARRPG